MTLVRVMLADDHTLLVEAFRKLLEQNFDIVGTVSDGRALLDAAPVLKPDVVLLDIGMPLLNGLDAGRQPPTSNRGRSHRYDHIRAAVL